MGRTYFALLADRFITYKNKIGSSATRALVSLNDNAPLFCPLYLRVSQIDQYFPILMF